MFRQKELENMGFIVYRIWSTNWFQDKENEMKKIARLIDKVLSDPDNEKNVQGVRKEVKTLVEEFPLYKSLIRRLESK